MFDEEIAKLIDRLHQLQNLSPLDAYSESRTSVLYH